MAKGGVSIEIDASLIVAAYNAGLEDMFIAMSEFDELAEQLNVNKIDPDGIIDI